MTDPQVVIRVLSGKLPPVPSSIPKEFQKIIKNCLRSDPKSRPKFKVLHHHLSNITLTRPINDYPVHITEVGSASQRSTSRLAMNTISEGNSLKSQYDQKFFQPPPEPENKISSALFNISFGPTVPPVEELSDMASLKEQPKSVHLIPDAAPTVLNRNEEAQPLDETDSSLDSEPIGISVSPFFPSQASILELSQKIHTTPQIDNSPEINSGNSFSRDVSQSKKSNIIQTQSDLPFSQSSNYTNLTTESLGVTSNDINFIVVKEETTNLDVSSIIKSI